MPALKSMPLTVRFDPLVLRFDGASPGALAQAAGAPEITAGLDARRGRVDLPVNFANPAAMTGDGDMVTLRFTVLGGRPLTQVIAAQNEAVAADGEGRVMLPGPRTLMLRITQ